MADAMVPAVVSPEPFGRGSIDLEVPEGSTVRELVKAAVRAGLPSDVLARLEVYIDGERQDRATVLDRQLKAGQIVNLVVEPLGGGGGGRKDIGQILLSIAVIAVAGWVGGGAGGMIASKLLARMAAVGVTMLGQAAIAGMNKPKAPQQVNDRYALQNASNQYRPYEPLPVALGEVLVAPDMAAKTFTQTEGEDVWLYGILGLHYGPCAISDMKIGDTAVSSMGSDEFRMQAHLTPGVRNFSIYPNDVEQTDFNALELEATHTSAEAIVRASGSDGQRFEFDFFFPKGLYFQKDDGRVESVTVSVSFRYRKVDEDGEPIGSWTSSGSWSRGAATKEPFRATHAIELPLGRYEFELKRNVHADANTKRNHDIFWTALRAIAYRKPITDEVLSVVEFAVKASAINQGTLAPITCRIKPKVPILDEGDWSTVAESSNPAALARWLMTGPAAAIPLWPQEADLRLRTWYNLCEEYNWTAHHYLQGERSQEEALALLEKSGRASVFWDGSQLAATCWVEKPAPKQMFTGANLREHSFEVVYPDEVHALRVQFANLEKNGEPDELIVYADGYGETNAGGLIPATLFEVLSVDGQMTMERAYRDGRWALGQRKHQKRFDTWSCDAEYIACEYGDRVRLAITRANGPQLRVRCRRYSGSLVAGIRLTDAVQMVEGVSYVVDIRTADGIYEGVPVETVAGWQRELTFKTPRTVATSPKAGDLVAFGEPNVVAEDVEIVSIEPGPNLTAVLTGVRYVAPLLMAGETGPIPELESRLTLDRLSDPPMPVLLGYDFQPTGVRLSFDFPAWRGSPLAGFAVRWRAKPASGEVTSWEALPVLTANARSLRTPPPAEAPVTVSGVDVTRIEIEITALTVDGRRSKPMVATVSKAVPPAPIPAEWTVVPMPEAEDGSSQPYLVVSGVVDHEDVTHVRISWSTTDEGPWTEAYYGPPKTESYQVGPLVAGVGYYVRITFLSAQGVQSVNLIIGPRFPPLMTSNNVVPTAPSLVAIEEEIEDLFDVTETLEGDFAAAELLLGGVQADLTAAEGLLASVQGEINTARGGQANLGARITQVNQARIDGDANNASAINAVQTEVNNARGGEATLSARITQVNQARIDGDSSNASAISAVQASLTNSILSASILPAITTEASKYYTANVNGDPATIVDYPSANFGSDADGAYLTVSAGGGVRSKAVIRRMSGQKVRLKAKVKAVGVAGQIQFRIRGLNASYASASQTAANSHSLAADALTEVTSAIFNLDDVPSPNVYIRLQIVSQTALLQIYDWTVEDMTETARLDASITSVNQARIDGDSANASAISAVQTEVSNARGGQANLAARITQVNQARIDGDSTNASAINAVQTEVNTARGGQANLAARITQVNQARIDGDSTNASAINAVQTEVNTARGGQANLNARITQVATAVSDEAVLRASEISRVEVAANLAAQVGGGSINANPNFVAWTGSVAVGPDSWTRYNSGNVTVSKGPGQNERPYSVRTQSTSTANTGIYNNFGPASPGGDYIVVEAELTLVAGNLNGTGVSLYTYDASASQAKVEHIRLSTELGVGAGVVGKTYRISKMLDARHVSADSYRLYGMTRLSTFSPIGAVTIDWHRIAARLATAEEIAAGTVLPNLSASVQQNSMAIVELENQQALAYWEVVAAASGGKPARLKLTSSSLGAQVAIDYDQLFLGDNTVVDNATDTEQTTIGSNIRVIAKGAPFGAAGNLIDWYGPTGIALSAMSPANGYFGFMTTSPYVFNNAVANGVASLSVSALGSSSGTTNVTMTSGSLSVKLSPRVKISAGISFDGGSQLTGGVNGTFAVEVFEQNSAGVNVLASTTMAIDGINGGAVNNLTGGQINTFPIGQVSTKSGNVTFGVRVRRTSGAANFINLRATLYLEVI